MANKNSFAVQNTTTLRTKIPTKKRRLSDKTAMDIMQCGVASVTEDTNIYDAIAKMVAKNVSGLPVVNNNNLVGIISEKDLLKLLYETEYAQGNVEDFMTKTVTAFQPNDTVKNVCNCLINNSFRRVPILNKGRLVGIISRADIIKAAKHNLDKTSGCIEKNGVIAEDVMKCGLITVKEQTPLYQAMKIIVERHITGLPVVDDSMNLIGIITEKDMLKAAITGKTTSQTVQHLMTKEVISFNPDDSLFDICDCLLHNAFRRVTIVDDGKLVGVISRADIIMHILKHRTAFFTQKQSC